VTVPATDDTVEPNSRLFETGHWRGERMTLDEVLAAAGSAGYEVESQDRTGNDDGHCVRFKTGEIVNVFDSGRLSYQGKNQSKMRAVLEGSAGSPSSSNRSSTAGSKVFVVYGHDDNARTQLEAMLLRWGYEPLILDQLPSEGQTVIEKLEKYTNDNLIGFGVVLATPDDVGYASGKEDEKLSRARQNVVLELGMLLSKLGRSRVAILLKDQADMERPSDIQGLIYIPFTDSVEETKVMLAKEMGNQGLSIDVSKL
jgi:predicted nucleotide-binding protein